MARTVQTCRFDKRIRNAVHVLLHHIHGKYVGREGNDLDLIGVEPIDLAENDIQRCRAQLKGDHHGGKQQHKQRSSSRKAVLGEGKRRQTSEQNDDRGMRGRDEQRVCIRSYDRTSVIGQQPSEVVERNGRRKLPGMRRQILREFKGASHHDIQREYDQNRHQQQEQIDQNGSDGIFLFHKPHLTSRPSSR